MKNLAIATIIFLLSTASMAATSITGTISGAYKTDVYQAYCPDPESKKLSFRVTNNDGVQTNKEASVAVSTNDGIGYSTSSLLVYPFSASTTRVRLGGVGFYAVSVTSKGSAFNYTIALSCIKINADGSDSLTTNPTYYFLVNEAGE